MSRGRNRRQCWKASGPLKWEGEAIGLTPVESAWQIVPAREQEGNSEVFFQVADRSAIVSGRTALLKDVLPSLGAKWDRSAGIWRMSVTRTGDLVAACEQKRIRVEQVPLRRVADENR